MSFVRPSREYSFYGQTQSLCEVCLRLINAKITIEGDDVYHLKRCPEHGAQAVAFRIDQPGVVLAQIEDAAEQDGEPDRVGENDATLQRAGKKAEQWAKGEYVVQPQPTR